jgi:uncharacterized protein
MKKILSLASLLMVTGVATSCFADTYDEGKTAYEQKRYSDALTSYSKACESGNTKACLNLGSMYEKGEGLPQNKHQASILYTKACRAHEALGCSSMAALSYDNP